MSYDIETWLVSRVYNAVSSDKKSEFFKSFKGHLISQHKPSARRFFTMIEGAAINKTLSNNLAKIDLSCGRISSKLVASFQRYDRSKMYNLNEMPCIIG
jgi:hypothetical protein